MMREIATPTMLHDGSGMGGLVGISAAILAEEGFTGAPAVTVEAPEAAPFWADLGRFWQIEHQYVKPYPVCRWAHAAIDAAAEICARHEVDPDAIAAIRISSFDYAVALFQDMPATTSQAQYSLPFAVACQIVHGRIGLEHISGAGLSDPGVARLVSRTTCVSDPRHQARYPEGRWGDVALTMSDGRVLRSGDVHASGGPERPFDRERIVAKYMSFAVPALGEARATGLRDAVLSLTDPGTRFADAARFLFDPV
jgi:2-methylcitrate dehydratase PrpD